MAGNSLLNARGAVAQTVPFAFLVSGRSMKRLLARWTISACLAMVGVMFFMCVYHTDQLACLTNSCIQGLFKGLQPFYPDGMAIALGATNTHGSRIGTAPLAIVELVLKQLPEIGTPGTVLFQHLRASFASNPNDLKHIQRTFDLDLSNTTAHKRKMKSVATTLQK